MQYNYTKEINSELLTKEIQDSSITVALDYISSVGDSISIYFKATLSEPEETILEGLIESHVNEALEPVAQVVSLNVPKTSTGLQKIAIYEPEGSSATVVSHNYADKCSWYQGAVQVTAGSLSNVGLVYSDPNNKTHWIDLEHGRIYDEDNIMAATSNTYKVKVYIDAVLITTGFTVDYEAGTVTFDESPSGTVTASYWYADKSWYRLAPKSGKILSIKAAEVQFSAGTTLTSSGAFVFAPWFVSHPVYGTMEIPGQRIVYKNAKDFISSCNEGQGLIPKWGELTEDVHVFPFNYARPKHVKYSDYIEIRVYCAGHEAVGGEYATATFYVTIDNEL